MYLTKRTYVKNWDHMKPNEKHNIVVKKANKIVEAIKPERISHITEEIGYWRKANAIHKWFVDNCQDGVDDCRDAYVGREDLEKLLGVVNKVLSASKLVKGKVSSGKKIVGKELVDIMVEGKEIEDPSVAKELLPVQEGFFFGSYQYDEWYYNDLVETKKIIEVAIKEEKVGGSIYYHSSW